MIFAANHHSHVDAGCCCRRSPSRSATRSFVGAAADYFFRTRVSSALAALALNAIPIERTKVTRRSADQAAELIDDGWSMVIFPEGGRSPDGWGQPFRGGAAYLAIRCGVPVVPVHLEGTGRILPQGLQDHSPGPDGRHVRATRVAGRARVVPEVRRRASSTRSRPWPTRRRPTGTRPDCGPTPQRVPRSPGPTSGHGAGTGRSAIGASDVAATPAKRRWPDLD